MTSRRTDSFSGAGFLGIGLAFVGAAIASDQPGLLGGGLALAGVALASMIRRHLAARR